ncbi:CaiB/BaiF CoA-transferase family protein [Agathobaculum sp. TL06]
MHALEGMTVLDLTRFIAGPFATMTLADFGARVIKIENPNEPDGNRAQGPYVDVEGEAFSAWFAQMNRNKEGMTLNLKDPEAKKLFLKMVEKADVVIENFRAGTMDKLGLGYDVLRQANPKIIYAAMSGYGQDGPYKTWPSFDGSGQAMSGLWSLNGYVDQPPVRMGTAIADYVTGFYGAIAVLTAYVHRMKTGEGQMIDLAQLDSTLTVTEAAVVGYTAGGEVEGTKGNEAPRVRPYSMYPCKDGYVFFGAYTDNLWKKAARFFGDTEAETDPDFCTTERRYDNAIFRSKVEPRIIEWFSQYTKQELLEGLSAQVPLNPIKTIKEAVEDPQINHRGMIVDIPHHDASIRMYGQPIKMSKTPAEMRRGAPKVGEDNQALFAEFFGCTPAQVAQLKENHTI